MSLTRVEKIDNILENYLKNGSDKKTLIEIRKDLMEIAKQDKSSLELLQPTIQELVDASSSYLNSKNLKGLDIINGLSTSILIPGNDDIKILLYGGKTNEDGSDIDINTPFDVASITKFFTLFLKDKLVELGVVKNEDKLNDLLPDFGDFKDFTLEDLSLLCGEIRTDGKITDAKTKDEAEEILKSAHLYSDDRTVNKYNDFGAMLTAIAITRKFNEKMDTNLTFEQLLIAMLERYGLNNTMFNPKNITVAGNGNLNNLVHDPKTRILGGATGAAGLFTTSIDQMKFANALFEGLDNYDIKKPVSPENIKKYGTITFPNSPQSNKGHFGLYQKNKEYNKSFAPRDYADSSFAVQGYTGSYMAFDPINRIHNTIFVSAINPKLVEKYKDYSDFKDYITNEKANGFIESFHTYQDVVTKNSLIINAVKKMLDEESKDNGFEIKLKVK